MVTTALISDLKAQARILHRRLQAGDELAGQRMCVLRHKRPPYTRGDCLAAIARELGFSGWPHALSVLTGRPEQDYGTLLHPASCHGFWNIWSAHYDEAQTIRAEHGGYLLAYRRQFLITEAPYIESLGVDPLDPDWARIGRDWVKPADRAAWLRLCAQVVRARRIVS